MHFEKIQLVQVQNGANRSLFTFTWPLFVNRARWLDHYYKTKCVISGENAS